MAALMADEMERCADPLDDASRVSQSMLDGGVAHAAYLSAPEQQLDANGEPSVLECVDCGVDLGERAKLLKVRCLRCQELLERRRRGLFRGQ